jgi:hypothetical protein
MEFSSMQSGVLLDLDVSERELAFLTAYLMNDYVPQNLEDQRFVNTVFDLLGLDRFDVNKLSPMSKSVERHKCALDEAVAAFILKSMNGPMPTRFARNIGMGSSFFSRVMSAKRLEHKKAKQDLKAVAGEKTDAEVVDAPATEEPVAATAETTPEN